MTGYRYIYDFSFANELIEHGFKPVGCGFNAKSQKGWIKFIWQDVEDYLKIRKRGSKKTQD